MRYLLDTHTFLWSIDEQEKLPRNVQDLIEDTSSSIYISITSLWEISIKVRNGKVELQKELSELIQLCSEKHLNILPIILDNVLVLNNLELRHRDPFDRIIIAQAICEDLTIVTKDPEFKLYPVKALWK